MKETRGTIVLKRKQVIEALSQWLEKNGYGATAYSYTDYANSNTLKVHVRFTQGKDD
jgi:hypothetical protein